MVKLETPKMLRKLIKLKKILYPLEKLIIPKLIDKLNSWKTIDFDSNTDTLKSYLDKIVKRVLKNIEDKLNKKSTVNLKRHATTGQIKNMNFTQRRNLPLNRVTIGASRRRKTLKKKSLKEKKSPQKNNFYNITFYDNIIYIFSYIYEIHI